ncbi:helix-turn-helix transcriptional regulator [Rubinisphaera italica]|uniref:HTH domain protein n=1 Tax=Rubinisphaera italica TaxID=2527969 RepID=A0A5C5XER6_9PLAN|nr:WYL domain-containing protein [Rubinisphaera italica]TWT60833.1 HTH domain protein [Rubinisphaera italica]
MAKKKASRKKPPGPEVPRRPDRDRRVRQSERMARVLSVLYLIQSQGRYNTRAIAEELEVSERTVFRDLEVLEFSGVPWFFDAQDQCYRVRPDYRFPTLALTEEEAISQAMATTLSKAPSLSVGNKVASVTRKLTATSKEEIKEILADAAEIMQVFDLKFVDHSKHHLTINTVQHALLAGKQLTGVYESPYEESPVKLVIHPYRLCLIKRAWYIIGHLEGEGEAKTLRVARFKSLRMLDLQANVPEDFNLREHFGNAWSVYRGETSYDIELRFESEASSIVTETQWHHTQQVTKHRDGSVTMKFTVDGLNEILRWILSWSGTGWIQF